ncbi:MAG: hypothetical protein IPL79_15785 [Myxococcales bacterium]|nr:hypothetical protein [Myxococcales bacterium]
MQAFPSNNSRARLRAWFLAAGLSAGSLFLTGSVAPAFADDAIQRLDITQLGAAEFAMLNDELYKVSRAFENDFADHTRRPGLAIKLYRLEQLGMAMLASGGLNSVGTRSTELRLGQVSELRAIVGRITQLNESFFLRALAEYHKAEGEPPRRLFGALVDKFGPIDRRGKKKYDVAKAYAKAVAEGQEVGATIHPLNKAFIDGLGNNELAEWVAREDGSTVASKNGAKHLDMGKGKVALSAGGLKVLRSPNGEIQMVYLMPNSGSYKPSVASIEVIRQDLLEMGVPADRIATPAYLVGNSAIYHVALMSVGVDRKEAKAKAAALEDKTIEDLEAKLQPLNAKRVSYLSTLSKAQRTQARLEARRLGTQVAPRDGTKIKAGKNQRTPRGKR